MPAQLRSLARFHPGPPETAHDADARWVEIGELVDVDDAIVVGRESLFEDA